MKKMMKDFLKNYFMLPPNFYQNIIENEFIL